MIKIFEHYSLGEKLYSQTVSKVYNKYNLTFMEFNIIMFLANNPEYDTASDIVKYRALTKSHVSMSIKSLSKKNLIAGNYIGDDRRSVHLKLTPLTADIITDGRIAQEEFYRIVNDGLTDDDRNKLNEILLKIDNNIEKNLEYMRSKNHAR